MSFFWLTQIILVISLLFQSTIAVGDDCEKTKEKISHKNSLSPAEKIYLLDQMRMQFKSSKNSKENPFAAFHLSQTSVRSETSFSSQAETILSADIRIKELRRVASKIEDHKQDKSILKKNFQLGKNSSKLLSQKPYLLPNNNW